MLSYRHAFHAGNDADVLKHLILSLCLQALCRKESPFCYLDSHAGTGFYDLTNHFAQKTGEFKEGIQRLWDLPSAEIHPLAQNYLAILRSLNGEKLTTYAGSAAIAQHFLRPQDSMTLMELHPSDFLQLKAAFKHDKQVHLHQRDGFEALIALTPPLQKRGLVLIDPSYEIKHDYFQVVDTLQAVYKRWQNGIYLLWYPLLQEKDYQQRLLKKLAQCGIPKILVAELTRYPSHTPRAMYGSGMVIINPPFPLVEQLQTVLPWVWQLLSPRSEGEWRVEWLVEE